jgi:alkylation response protein AidB-like acyl-CoA dehydrogenase
MLGVRPGRRIGADALADLELSEPNSSVRPMVEPGGPLDELRASLRTWCESHVPKNWREEQGGVGHEESVAFLRWWSTQLSAAGLLAPHWPKEWGGGFSIPEQVVIAEELARAGAPRNALFHVAVYNVAPTIIHNATEEQKKRFLSGMIAGETWCQGFSEPNAGSDLASLQTRAVRDGDDYVVNGQKVWTSWAREASWCMLLVRTDPEASKHKGISCLVVPMDSPGIEVRQIRQAWGPRDFCEVFFDDVHVPVENLIGAENNGWAVAQGTLAAERAITILDMAERLRRKGIGVAVQEAAGLELEDGSRAIDDPAVQEFLAECYAEAEVLRSILNGMIDDIIQGADVSGTASIIKIFYSELLYKLTEGCTDLLGPRGQLDGPVLASAGWETGFWMNDYIHSFGWLIGGGTSEIMRNVIGERMLGLPR